MTTLIAVFALGVLAKCLWDFLWDALDRRHDRRYTTRAQAQPIGSLADEIPASSPATAPKLELIRTKRCPEGYGAAQALGYTDGGSRRHPSAFCPEAQTSAEALAAWDRRHDGPVA